MKSLKHSLKGYLIAGLLVWLPIGVTLFVLRFIIDLLDGTLDLLPKDYQPQQLFGFQLPGMGVILSVAIILVTGILVTNFLGKKLMGFWDALVSRIPFVRAIYNASKQVATTLFSKESQSFKKVFLFEYPRKGIWSIAFQSGSSSEEVETKLGEETLTLFVPTTPNPTSGFLMLVPKKEAIELEMTVDQALKFIISLGVVQPTTVVGKING